MSPPVTDVFLLPRKAQPFFGRHPWVFEGAIDRVVGTLDPRRPARLLSAEGKFIAWGLGNLSSKIRLRLFSWDEQQPINDDLIVQRLQQAIALRHQTLGLDDPQGACRLVFSEADGLSGLIIDRYGPHLVMQWGSQALAHFEPVVVETLQQELAGLGELLIHRRLESDLSDREGLTLKSKTLVGDEPSQPVWYQENGLRWAVDLAGGQKTGGYLDQRDNRRMLAQWARGKHVLDVCCYTGGFALTAAHHQAASVTGIDRSAPALGLAQQNADANNLAAHWLHEDAQPALQRLARDGQQYDIVILDPPKFARTAGGLAKALKGYEHLNRAALALIKPGGLLVTCSCSGHVKFDKFLNVLVGVAQHSNRELQILHQAGPAPDHPYSVYCLESSYLKCVFARVKE